MTELRYNVCESGIKKLINIKLHKDKSFNQNIRKVLLIYDFLLIMYIWIKCADLNDNMIESLIVKVALFIVFRLLASIIVWLGKKILIRQYLMQNKVNLNKEVCIKIENDIFTAKLGDFEYKCNTSNVSILGNDYENIYIKFKDKRVIYIPKNAFEGTYNINEFLKLFEGNNI